MAKKPKGPPTPKINCICFSFAVIVSLMDSSFTHGYQSVCFRIIKEPVTEWLTANNITESGAQSEMNTAGGSEGLLKLITFFGFADASFSFGGVAGSCLIIHFANKFGRKGGILMTAFISIFACLFVGYSKFFDSPLFIVIGRILYGIKHGINSGLEPMYLIEISPQNLRGRVGMLYGLFVSLGTVVGITTGFFVGTNTHWPLVLSLPVIPAIIQLMLLPYCPESPKYLRVIKNKELECRKALKWFRGKGFQEEEVKQLRTEYYQYHVLGEIHLGFILKNSVLRIALMISCILMASQQLCGVTMLLDYVAKYVHDSDYLKNLFSIPKVLGSFIVFFFIIEKFSTRNMLIVSFTGMAISSMFLFIILILPQFYFKENLILILIIFYLLMYKIGTGSLSWYVPSEYFNTISAPIGYAVGCGVTWLFKLFIIGFALPLSNILKEYTFLNYFVTNVLLAYFSYLKVSDTRNKTLKEIYRNIYWIYYQRGV